MKEILQVRDQEENDIVLQISIYDTIRNKTVFFHIFIILIFYISFINILYYFFNRFKLKVITILIKMMMKINWQIWIIYHHLLLNM